jgi:hypothetical protein
MSHPSAHSAAVGLWISLHHVCRNLVALSGSTANQAPPCPDVMSNHDEGGHVAIDEALVRALAAPTRLGFRSRSWCIVGVGAFSMSVALYTGVWLVTITRGGGLDLWFLALIVASGVSLGAAAATQRLLDTAMTFVPARANVRHRALRASACARAILPRLLVSLLILQVALALLAVAARAPEDHAFDSNVGLALGVALAGFGASLAIAAIGSYVVGRARLRRDISLFVLLLENGARPSVDAVGAVLDRLKHGTSNAGVAPLVDPERCDLMTYAYSCGVCIDLVLDLLREGAVVLGKSQHWLGPRAQRTWLRRLELELDVTPPCGRPGPVQTQVFRSLVTSGSTPIAQRLDDLRPLWLRVIAVADSTDRERVLRDVCDLLVDEPP